MADKIKTELKCDICNTRLKVEVLTNGLYFFCKNCYKGKLELELEESKDKKEAISHINILMNCFNIKKEELEGKK